MEAVSASNLAKRENGSESGGPSTGPRADAAIEHSGVGLYKYGQGYWVRTMTAIFAGILVLVTAMWAWDSLNAIKLPMREWRLSTTNPTGSTQVGQTLTLLKADVQPPVTLGTASVKAIEGSAITVGDINITAPPSDTAPYSIASTTQMQSSDGAFSALVAQRSGIEIFDKVYLQMGVALLLLLAGCIAIYSLVGKMHNSVDFLIATDGEMKKVNWATRKVVIDSTYVVIGATFLIALILYIFDALLSRFFVWIKVLEG